MSHRKADNLLLFKSIIDAGSLSAAAKMTDISVSQASKRMSQLEKALGIKLLQRSTRQLSLTSAGNTLYQKLSSIKTQIDEAWESMLAYGDEPRGQLSIAAPYHYGITILMPLIRLFSQQYPRIHIDLDLFNQKKDNSEVDIYFKSHVLGDKDLLPDCQLIAKKVHSEALCYVASKAWLDQHKIINNCQEIAEHHLKKLFNCNSFEAMIQAAINDMGIIRIPESLLEQQGDKELVKLAIDSSNERLETYVYYHAHQPGTKKVNLFLKLLRNVH